MRGFVPDELSGTRLTDRYVVFDAIASGGMATVLYGRMLGPAGFSRTVAIKRLHQHLAQDPEFVAMFLDEARLAGRVQHPNVISTIDVVAASGELFIVMEYIQGEALSRVLSTMRVRKERMPLAIAVAVLVDALRGLHAAHEARDERGMSLGIVHRDVSPQNILVGADGRSRVFDFGVAKAAGRVHSTQGNEVKGKLAYMAPEQLSSKEIDRAADIFAASVVAWEALTGKRFHPDMDEARIIARTLGGKQAAPSSLVPDTARFDAVILRGLAKDPRARWATALEMAHALEACCAPANADVVAEWLRHAVGNHLANKAERVAAIEMRTPAAPASVREPVTETTTALSVTPPATTSPWVIALVAAMVAASAIGLVLIFVIHRSPAPPPAAIVVGASAEPEGTVEVPPPVVTVVLPEAVVVDAAAPASVTKQRARPAPAKSSSKPFDPLEYRQ